ncbi:MAG TPA: hypothetical protein VFR59_11880 [Steroidobacteraceae bacterium]|nr:hypothetical protein [Steroidobacteraceae bacterium]
MTKRNAGPGPTNDAAPPGDDLARYLELFASQVSVSVRESEQPVATLAHCMLAVSDEARQILDCLHRSAAAPQALDRATIERNCAAMLERLQLAVVAFQFHDLLTQRLQHVRTGLAELAATLQDPRQRHNPEHWNAMGERIRDRYSLQEQRSLFEELVNGVTPSGRNADTDGEDEPARVELF